jgi:cytochrome oxidase Cu insertion factor (SCO1/SenC/PrrC family)
MKLRLALALAFALLLAPLAANAQHNPLGHNPKLAITSLKVGEKAPNFTLLSDQGNPVTLSSFRGKKTVVLAFYILAFTEG